MERAPEEEASPHRRPVGEEAGPPENQDSLQGQEESVDRKRYLRQEGRGGRSSVTFRCPLPLLGSRLQLT